MPVFETEMRPSFGETLIETETPSVLSFKDPMIIRILRTLAERKYLGAVDAERIQLCLDEAIKNAMLHGNKYHQDKLVGYHLYADGDKWGLVISDQGSGMTPEKIPQQLEVEDDLRESGYGVMLMDQMLDEVVYMGGGNHLLMVKKRSDQALADPAELIAVEVMSEEEMDKVGVGYIEPAGDASMASMDFDLDADWATPPPVVEKEAVPEFEVGITGATLLSETATLRVHEKNGLRIAELLTRQISDYNLDLVRPAIVAAAEGQEVIILDLGHVSYASSVVLGAFVNIYKELKGRGAQLRISSMTPTIAEVFKITHLDRLLPNYPNADAAIIGDVV
ncbi:MAG: ATP-binding protein [Planctomycetota bacterium]|nr:ATP-binding protein [Planctomycetota bacterium]MDA1142448.1 ATP-binding protein [Planctomycetota bacterium]